MVRSRDCAPVFVLRGGHFSPSALFEVFPFHFDMGRVGDRGVGTVGWKGWGLFTGRVGSCFASWASLLISLCLSPASCSAAPSLFAMERWSSVLFMLAVLFGLEISLSWKKNTSLLFFRRFHQAYLYRMPRNERRLYRLSALRKERTYWSHSQDDYSFALHDSALHVWFQTLSSCADRLLRRPKPGRRKMIHSCLCLFAF